MGVYIYIYCTYIYIYIYIFPYIPIYSHLVSSHCHNPHPKQQLQPSHLAPLQIPPHVQGAQRASVTRTSQQAMAERRLSRWRGDVQKGLQEFFRWDLKEKHRKSVIGCFPEIQGYIYNIYIYTYIYIYIFRLSARHVSTISGIGYSDSFLAGAGCAGRDPAAASRIIEACSLVKCIGNGSV